MKSKSNNGIFTFPYNYDIILIMLARTYEIFD